MNQKPKEAHNAYVYFRKVRGSLRNFVTHNTATFFRLDHVSCGDGHQRFFQTKSEAPALYIGLHEVNWFTNKTYGQRLSGEDEAPLYPLASRIDVYISHVFKSMMWWKLSDRRRIAQSAALLVFYPGNNLGWQAIVGSASMHEKY